MKCDALTNLISLILKLIRLIHQIALDIYDNMRHNMSAVNWKSEEAIMSDSNTAKHEEMRANHTFNHRASSVSADIFVSSQFFDAHDLIQVKYEMLRAVEKEKHDITSASAAFGFSRIGFYDIKKEFDEHGILGLLPKKRGPKGPRKLSDSDIEFVKSLLGTHTKAQIIIRLREERGVLVSKRTLERRLFDKKNP